MGKRDTKVKEEFGSVDELLATRDFDEDVEKWIKENWNKVKESTELLLGMTDINFISAVENPNMESRYIFSSDFEEVDDEVYMDSQFLLKEDKKERVYAAVLTSDMGVDGLLAPEPAIKKSSEKFIEKIAEDGEKMIKAIDKEHNQIGGKGKIVGSMTLPDDAEFEREDGEVVELNEGDWVVEAKFDEEMMENVKEGNVTGWSIDGRGIGFRPTSTQEFAENKQHKSNKEGDKNINMAELDELKEQIEEIKESVEEIDTGVDFEEDVKEQFELQEKKVVEGYEDLEEMKSDEEYMEQVSDEDIVGLFADHFDVGVDEVSDMVDEMKEKDDEKDEDDEEDMEESVEEKGAEGYKESTGESEETDEDLSPREKMAQI